MDPPESRRDRPPWGRGCPEGHVPTQLASPRTWGRRLGGGRAPGCLCGDGGDPGQRSCHGARETLRGSQRKRGGAGREPSREPQRQTLRASLFGVLHSWGVVGVRGRARGASVGFAELERVALLGQGPRSECMKLCRGASGLLGGEPLWGRRGGGADRELGCQDRAPWSRYCCIGVGARVSEVESHCCGRIEALRPDGATPEESESESRAASCSRGEIRVFPPSLSRRWKQLERKRLPGLRGLVIVYRVSVAACPCFLPLGCLCHPLSLA